MTRFLATTLLAALAIAVGAGSSAAQSGSSQGPRPFPGAPVPPATAPQGPAPQATAPGGRPPASQPVTARPPAGPAQAPLTPLETTLGVSLYSTAQLLDIFDAGSGQKFYIFGVDAAYSDVVQFYRTALKSGGRELYRAPSPAMHQFDLGRFQEETMAFPPSVVVKDYAAGSPAGYLHIDGTVEKRFKTIVQIIPAPPVVAR